MAASPLRQEHHAAARAARRPRRRSGSTPTSPPTRPRFATMSMLVPPQMLNTMVPARLRRTWTEDFYADPIRRYMIPVASDRRTDWPSHPYATRDSLHEHDMWVAEGLTHRYPTKVLAELLSTCPQYCGHCTRMDLVGNSHAHGRQAQAHAQAGRPLRGAHRLPARPSGRPRRRRLRRRRGQHAVAQPRVVPHAAARHRDHPRHPAGHQGTRRAAAALARPGRRRRARARRPYRQPAAASTSPSTPTSTTPSRSRRWSPSAAQTALDVGVRDVRNQGVLMRGVNATWRTLLDLCFALQGEAGILPVLLLHVRHDPQRRALAGLGQRMPRACSTTSWATCPDTPLRASCATCRSSASAGCTWSPSTTARTASRTGPRTTARPSRTRHGRPDAAVSRTTTRSTRCPRRARSEWRKQVAAGKWEPARRTSRRPTGRPAANIMQRCSTPARHLIGREQEFGDIVRFLENSDHLSAALVLRGEAGIGKTTLWLAGLEAANARGYRTLAARPPAGGGPLLFRGLADLLGESAGGCSARATARIQRRALEAALLLGESGIHSGDRAVPAAFLGALRLLAADSPVLPRRRRPAVARRRITCRASIRIRPAEREPVAALLAVRGGLPDWLHAPCPTSECRRLSLRASRLVRSATCCAPASTRRFLGRRWSNSRRQQVATRSSCSSSQTRSRVKEEQLRRARSCRFPQS